MQGYEVPSGLPAKHPLVQCFQQIVFSQSARNGNWPSESSFKTVLTLTTITTHIYQMGGASVLAIVDSIAAALFEKKSVKLTNSIR